VSKIYPVLAVYFFLTSFIPLSGLSFSMAGGCSGGSTEAGKSVNPDEVREIPDEKPVKARSGPNPYTDDVIQMKKKMQNSETPQSKADADEKGAEVDKSE
jgi:hypothetical protein